MFTSGHYTGPLTVDQQSMDIRQCRLSRVLRLFCGFVGLFHISICLLPSRHWLHNHTDTHTTTHTHTQQCRHVSYHLSACMCACVDSCKNVDQKSINLQTTSLETCSTKDLYCVGASIQRTYPCIPPICKKKTKCENSCGHL